MLSADIRMTDQAKDTDAVFQELLGPQILTLHLKEELHLQSSFEAVQLSCFAPPTLSKIICRVNISIETIISVICF